MNKVRNQFVRYAMLSVFALLTVLLTIINGINFTMAGNDADMITQMICDRHGSLTEPGYVKKKKPATPDSPTKKENAGSMHMGPMGPEAPDMNSSLRYFTFTFDYKGNPGRIAYDVSAVDENEAREWARSLSNESGTGWTRGTYRYRVYKEGTRTYVIVIDQGRELLPSYRILVTSVFGELLVLLISYFILKMVGKRLFAPLEEADRKQKRFIANIESEFKVPLTVINADTELIEKESGSSDYTKSINRQVKKMTALVKDIGTLTIFEENDKNITMVDLSGSLLYALDYHKKQFEEKGLTLDMSVEDDIVINGDDVAVKKLIAELIENSLRYSEKYAFFELRSEDERIILTQRNGTKLPSGTCDQIFDRFTVLENAVDEAIGLGLSFVKDVVREHNGRISAKVSDGEFILRIAL